MKKSSISFYKYMSPSIIWTGIIFYLLLTRAPMEMLHQFKYYTMAFVRSVLGFSLSSIHNPSIGMLDKVAHFGTFAVFAFLFAWGLYKQPAYHSFQRHALWLSFAVTIALGGLTEYLQYLLTTFRAGDWIDFAADVLGGAAGLLFFLLWKRKTPSLAY